MQIVSSMPKELKSKSIVPMSIEPIELKPVMVNLEYLITSFTQTFRSQYSDCTESVILIIINIINFHWLKRSTSIEVRNNGEYRTCVLYKSTNVKLEFKIDTSYPSGDLLFFEDDKSKNITKSLNLTTVKTIYD